MTINVASFFSGIGGFDLGFERAGMNIVFQCEIDKFSQRILKKHWPNVDRHDDIRTLQPSFIPESNVWCAGFPCQDISLANNGKREGLNGKRSGLFYTFIQHVNRRTPQWLVIENVPGLLSSNQGGDFQTILKTLDELGYCVAWRVLDAKYFGTPQRRRRVFIVASYRSQGAIKVLFDNQRAPITSEAFGSQKETPALGSRNGNLPTNIYSIQNAAIGRVHTSGPQAKGYRNDGETWTLDSRGRGDVVCATTNPFGIRIPPEVSTEVDSNRYRSLGNAVNVSVAEWIGRGIVEATDKSLPLA